MLQNVTTARPQNTPQIPQDHDVPTAEPNLTSLQLLQNHTQDLTPQQSAAISLLLTGRSDAKAAAAIGVTRVTVTRWRLYNHVFQAELNRRRSQTWTAAADRIRTTLEKAVRVFKRQIRSDDQHIAFRAARALLHLAGSSRFVAPPDPSIAPHDPFAVLDLEARKVHIQLASIDPRLDPLEDDDRAKALRQLLNKAAQHPDSPENQQTGA